MTDQRTIASVQVTTWPSRILAAVVALVVLGTATGAHAQEDGDEPECTATAPIDVVFVGRATAMNDDLVTFVVSEVRSGRVEGETITVRYPSRYNARELEVGEDYLVPLVDVATGASALEEPRSYVDTAELGTCASGGTRMADGSPIDTGALAGVGPALTTYGAWAAAVLAGLLALLVVLGRFLDRRSRYRRWIRL
jgi:hypothetical protein